VVLGRLVLERGPRVTSSIEPLTISEQARFLEVLGQLEREDQELQLVQAGWKYRANSRFVARGLRSTYWIGWHVSVLSRPTHWNLRIDETARRICWTRPKNRRIMRFPITPELAGWIEPYIGSLPEHNERWWARWASDLGRRAHLPGLSFRTLRHTAIWIGSDPRNGLRPNDVAQLYGCTIQQAIDYAMSRETAAIDRLEHEGFRAQSAI